MIKKTNGYKAAIHKSLKARQEAEKWIFEQKESVSIQESGPTLITVAEQKRKDFLNSPVPIQFEPLTHDNNNGPSLL